MHSRSFPRFGATARSWNRIVAFYGDLASQNSGFADYAALAEQIASSPYVAAGLCAVTSMHTLILGLSTHVLDNPHLVINYDFEARKFMLQYVDGSSEPWTRDAAPEEVYEQLERFFIKRARWFQKPTNFARRPIKAL